MKRYLLILATTIVSLLGIYFLNINRRLFTAKEAAPTIPTQTLTPAANSINDLKYVSSRYGFSFTYPSDWEYLESDLSEISLGKAGFKDSTKEIIAIFIQVVPRQNHEYLEKKQNYQNRTINGLRAYENQTGSEYVISLKDNYVIITNVGISSEINGLPPTTDRIKEYENTFHMLVGSLTSVVQR